MASQVLSLAGWTFLPDLITNNLQSFYYNFTIRAGEPKPPPGSPAFKKHRRNIHIVVIGAYLLYTLYEAHWEVQRAGNFYRDLGLPFNAEEKTINSKFRRLTLLYHPDKVADAARRPEVEQQYMQLTLARDTLINPAKRYAYDRFGPDITGWQHCITVRDYALVGLKRMLPYYTASVLGMLIFSYLGFFDWGKYWRFLAIAALAVFELHAVTRPTSTSNSLSQLLASILPQSLHYLPFQTVQVAHKSLITLFIALQRLTPLLRDPNSTGDEASQLLRQTQRVEQLSNMAATEATRLLALDIVPFHAAGQSPGTSANADAGAASATNESENLNNNGLVVGGGRLTKMLRDKVRDWLVTNTVRSDKEVVDAVGRVMQRRREEAQVARARMVGVRA